MRVSYELGIHSPPGGRVASPARLRIHGRQDPQRGAVEAFIAAGFARHFGAEITQFSPLLASLSDGERILAAAGYRRATDTLFLEAYLDTPVDSRISQLAGEVVARHAIAEVGQLATRAPRHLGELMNRLSDHLSGNGVQWVAITATRPLRQVFERFGLRSHELAVANPVGAGIELAQWGRYYEHDPRVIAGSLAINQPRLIADPMMSTR
ncbi:MAG: thermostable hemolysin [Burkholderiaceae bacterium]